MSLKLGMNWFLTPWQTDEPNLAIWKPINKSYNMAHKSNQLFSENKPCLTILNYLLVYFFGFYNSFINFDKFKCKRVLIKSLLRNICISFVHSISTLMYSYCINALQGTQITYLRRCLNVLDRSTANMDKNFNRLRFYSRMHLLYLRSIGWLNRPLICCCIWQVIAGGPRLKLSLYISHEKYTGYVIGRKVESYLHLVCSLKILEFRNEASFELISTISILGSILPARLIIDEFIGAWNGSIMEIP